MRSEELKLVQTINSSLSDRRERSLLTPHSVAALGPPLRRPKGAYLPSSVSSAA